LTRAVAGPRIIVDGGAESAMRGLSEKRREVIEDMGSFAGGELMGLLKDPETNWQPQDWLPDPSGDDFLDQVRASTIVAILQWE
jgi:acyl-[acyl-carrier-protein] desaturase